VLSHGGAEPTPGTGAVLPLDETSRQAEGTTPLALASVGLADHWAYGPRTSRTCPVALRTAANAAGSRSCARAASVSASPSRRKFQASLPRVDGMSRIWLLAHTSVTSDTLHAIPTEWADRPTGCRSLVFRARMWIGSLRRFARAP
jgi:hypothetical protein